MRSSQILLLTAALVGATVAQNWGEGSLYAGGECSSDADCGDGQQCVYTYCVSQSALSSVVASLTSANSALIPLIPTSFPASASLPTAVLPTDFLSQIYSGHPASLPGVPTDLPTSAWTDIPTGLPTDIFSSLPTSLPTSISWPISAPTDLPTFNSGQNWGPSYTTLPVPSDNFPSQYSNLPGWGSSAWSTLSASIPTSIPTTVPTSIPTSIPTSGATYKITTAPGIPLVTASSAVPSKGTGTIISGKNSTNTHSGGKSTNTPTGPTAPAVNGAGIVNVTRFGSILIAVAVVMVGLL